LIVDLALFEGDTLLERVLLCVSSAHQESSFGLFSARYWLGVTNADIVLEQFSPAVELKRVALDMPIHESNDWESLDLGKYQVAFWCKLEA
jgi:hypothetical protein